MTPFGHVSAASTNDPLGCAPTVFDPADYVDDPAVAEHVRSAEGVLGADVRVGSDRDRRWHGRTHRPTDRPVRQVERSAGELGDDRIVVMFSRTEREAALYYGGDHADVLEKGWESVVDTMTARLEVKTTNGTV